MEEEILQKLNWIIENIKNPQEIFTTEEACEYLRIGRNKFDEAVKNGEIMFKSNGNKKLFKKKWLDAWMEM